MTTSSDLPLEDTTNKLTRVTSKARERVRGTLTRILSLMMRIISRAEPSIGIPPGQGPLTSLSPATLKEVLKAANFLTPEWDESRAQLHHIQDEWEANAESAPVFPFGYHQGIWYKLQPDSDVMQAEFTIQNDPNRHTSLYPAGSSDWGMFHLEYYTYWPHVQWRSETHGFNCVGLGHLSWTKDSVNTTETQLQQSKWYPSPMTVIAEILEDGTSGPIWAIRHEAGELEEDIEKFNAATGFGTLALAKIGNIIDEMRRGEWSIFEGIDHCSGYRRYPLYQSRECGALRSVRDWDEKMKTDSEMEQGRKNARGCLSGVKGMG